MFKIKMMCVKCSYTITWWLDRLEDMDNPTGPFRIHCECGGLIEPIHKVQTDGEIESNK